jgi:hypothetical protein
MFVACSSDGDDNNIGGATGGAGGMPAVTGGAGPTGGVAPTGTGGTVASGGSVANGGSVASGGSIGAGGGPETGGGLATGGVQSSGGSANGGITGSGGTTASGGMPGGASNGGAATGGASGSGGNPGDQFDALRAACVAEINNYRQSLNTSLKALVRPNATTEQCSDKGAASDGASGVAHQSAGKCQGTNAQNTCPGWPTAQYGGPEPAMKQCLKQMWAEGEPPEGRQTCLNNYFKGDTACFLAHGHYLNMSDPGMGFVSCGFANLTGGKMWMNQDFGQRAP